MALKLPPPPIGSDPGSYAWQDWYNQLQVFYNTSGAIAWNLVDKTGSSLSDIVTRSHNQLQNVQGSGDQYHISAAQYAALGSSFVNSFNTRTGAVTLTSGDVTTALGFTPISSSVTTLSSLVSVGTITTGTWSATTIAVNKGGTGTTTATGSAGSVVLSVAPTLTGTVTFTGLLDISGAGAGQVKFPSTQNASADANTLDDYKESTATLAAVCGTSGTITLGNNVISKTKIGNIVFFTGLIDVSSVSAPNGTLTLTGLGDTTGNNNRNYSAVTIRVSGGTGNVTGNVWQAHIPKNTSTIVVAYYAQSAGSEGSGAANQMQAGTALTLSGHYMIN